MTVARGTDDDADVMLGEHDWFDKMSGIGRDHPRLMHMRELHALTDRRLAKIIEPGE